MEAYTIEVSLRIKNQPKGAYSEQTIAESIVTKKITAYARDIRGHTTRIVRQAVDNMSESAATALAQAVKEEVIEVGSGPAEPEALTV